MKQTVSYFHNYPAGDLIAAMAGIRQVWKNTGMKAAIYQELDKPAYLYDESKTATYSTTGGSVTMNRVMFDMLIPLIEAQEYVESFNIWKGEKCIVDLSDIHASKLSVASKGRQLDVDIPALKPVNSPHGSIHRWLFHAFPDMTCDLSEAWIVHPAPYYRHMHLSMVPINFSERYRNDNISYSFLRKFERNIIFIGTLKEHESFNKLHRLNLVRNDVADFNDLAWLLKESTFFLGNQSFCWNLAEAMKVPRILEVCPWIPNCITTGPNGYDFLYQEAAEYYFEKLFVRK